MSRSFRRSSRCSRRAGRSSGASLDARACVHLGQSPTWGWPFACPAPTRPTSPESSNARSRSSLPRSPPRLLGACGGDQNQDANQALSQLTKAATEMAEQAQQMAGGAAAGLKDSKPVPPVSFKKLIDYLPKDLEGMKASEPEGETTSAGPQGNGSTRKPRSTSGESRAKAPTQASSTTPTSVSCTSRTRCSPA